MLAAEADDQVRVVILGGAGKMFSAGHDLGSRESLAEREPGPGQHPTYRQYGGTRAGAEQRELPQHPPGDQRGRDHQRGRYPSRVRLPV